MRIKTRFSCRLGAPLAIAGCPGVPGTAAMNLAALSAYSTAELMFPDQADTTIHLGFYPLCVHPLLVLYRPDWRHLHTRVFGRLY